MDSKKRRTIFFLGYFSLFLTLWQLVFQTVFAQETFPRNDVADKRPSRYALINAHIYVDADTYLKHASLLIEDGRVSAVGRKIDIPPATPTVDLKARTVYPSFIDPYVADFGLKYAKRQKVNKNVIYPTRGGLYGSYDAVQAEFNAKDVLKGNKKQAEQLRNVGIGAVLSFRGKGVARGTGTLLILSSLPLQERIVLSKASAHYSIKRDRGLQSYPHSSQGVAALLRQMRYDAKWYASQSNDRQTNLSLEALHNTRHLPQIIEVPNVHYALLAHKIGQETGLSYTIKGRGDEYQLTTEISQSGAVFILPLNYPDAYEVEDPYKSLDTPLSDLKHWELAPANAIFLHKEDVRFAFTTAGLKHTKAFLPQLRKTIQHGLPKAVALRALTQTPAELLHAESQIGSLQPGRWANFFISSGDIFDKGTKIYEHWLQGIPYVFKDKDLPNYNGKYSLTVGKKKYEMQISGKSDAPKVRIKARRNDTIKYKAYLSAENHYVQLQAYSSKKEESFFRLSGWRSGKDLQGRGQDATGAWISWTAKYEDSTKVKQVAKKKKEASPLLGKVIYPFQAYGNEKVPVAATYLIKEATVWTNEAEGIIEKTDVLVQNGKISAVGQGLEAPEGATIVEGRGKHLTSGIIDEHSHSALFSINESSEAVTSQVRMSDVVNPTDVNIYRQLAGGVTVAHLLHGSANVIGGQSVLVKMRWGKSAEGMLVQDAPPFVKFALGENVKRGNSTETRPNWQRYPSTRMGVEQLIWDTFQRARAYGEAWTKYNSSKGKKRLPEPRRDLQLEAIWEVLQGRRFITCHSYVQSEVSMLMRLAERFGVRVNTFTHILEGYKVADKMFEHGAAASTLADWWAYKYEVREAIPYNAAIMHRAGLVVAVHSDSDELARRLNQEAAKTIKYGGLSEEEAWKTITLNPARMLHLDERMGSIRPGKDADLVLWSEHPLSIYTKAEKTFVDGTLYYDQSQEDAKVKQVEKERSRLIRKMIKTKKKS